MTEQDPTQCQHRFATRAEFEAACKNIREWPGEGFDVGECRDCHSTLSWRNGKPTWHGEPLDEMGAAA